MRRRSTASRARLRRKPTRTWGRDPCPGLCALRGPGGAARWARSGGCQHALVDRPYGQRGLRRGPQVKLLRLPGGASWFSWWFAGPPGRTSRHCWRGSARAARLRWWCSGRRRAAARTRDSPLTHSSRIVRSAFSAVAPPRESTRGKEAVLFSGFLCNDVGMQVESQSLW
jgi:hypothetical protein